MHLHLPAVACRLLKTYNTDWHIAKSECRTLSLCFSIGIINTEADLMSRLLVTTSNERHSVCYFLPLLRNKTDPLKLKSLCSNILDVRLSLLARLWVCSHAFSCACQRSFKTLQEHLSVGSAVRGEQLVHATALEEKHRLIVRYEEGRREIKGKKTPPMACIRVNPGDYGGMCRVSGAARDHPETQMNSKWCEAVKA